MNEKLKEREKENLNILDVNYTLSGSLEFFSLSPSFFNVLININFRKW